MFHWSSDVFPVSVSSKSGKGRRRKQWKIAKLRRFFIGCKKDRLSILKNSRLRYAPDAPLLHIILTRNMSEEMGLSQWVFIVVKLTT